MPAPLSVRRRLAARLLNWLSVVCSRAGNALMRASEHLCRCQDCGQNPYTSAPCKSFPPI